MTAEEEVAELLPCILAESDPGRDGCAQPGKHDGDCPAFYRPAVAERLRQRDEKLKYIVMNSSNDSTFMEAYSGVELQGEQCPVCHFPCDTQYATIMAIGDGKVAHLLCAYSIIRERIAALEAIIHEFETKESDYIKKLIAQRNQAEAENERLKTENKPLAKALSGGALWTLSDGTKCWCNIHGHDERNAICMTNRAALARRKP